MRKLSCLLAASCFVLSVAAPAAAQMAANDDAPPPVLVVQYEVVKPGHTGMMHEKTESMFIKAMKAAHAKEHYLGATSLSGDNRALFFQGYGSMADWQKDMESNDANATLSRQLDEATAADGEMLSVSGQAVLTLQADESNNTDKIRIGATRFWEIERYKIKPGHEAEWHAVVKMYSDALKKADPDAIWVLYRGMYGSNNGGNYTFFIPVKSMAEVDQHMGNDHKVMEAMGGDGMKKVGELMAACVESSSTNLFRVAPKMSYPTDGWVKADPAFWNSK